MITSQKPYTRRRYSNASVVGQTYGAASSGTHTLTAEPANPAQGSVSHIVTQSSSNENFSRVEQESVLRGASASYPAATTLRVTAHPATGYRFSHWTGDVPAGQGQSNPLNVVLSKDVALTAHFAATQTPPAPTQHRLTVNWNPEMGSVTGSGLAGGQMTVGAGTTVTLTARPYPGFSFVGWEGRQLVGNTQSNRSQTITFSVVSDITLTACFAAEDNPGGGGPANGDPDNGDPGNGGGDTPGGDTLTRAKAFFRKWWWAILIAAYLIYKETKGKKK